MINNTIFNYDSRVETTIHAIPWTQNSLASIPNNLQLGLIEIHPLIQLCPLQLNVLSDLELGDSFEFRELLVLNFCQMDCYFHAQNERHQRNKNYSTVELDSSHYAADRCKLLHIHRHSHYVSRRASHSIEYSSARAIACAICMYVYATYVLHCTTYKEAWF